MVEERERAWGSAFLGLRVEAYGFEGSLFIGEFQP